MEELQEDTQQSLRRWYTMAERSGDFDTRTDYITTHFFSPRNKVFLQFLFKDVTEQTKAISMRQVSYHDEWEVQPDNYLGTIHDSIGLISVGNTKDWQKELIHPGYVSYSTSTLLYIFHLHVLFIARGLHLTNSNTFLILILLNLFRENDRYYLDFVEATSLDREHVKFRNTIYFPLLLMEPPYFRNDMP